MALNIFKCLRALRPSQICQIKETPQFAVASIFAQKYSTVQTTQDEDFEKIIGSWDTTIKKQKTSRAMKVYLERAKEHDEFMKQQQITFQIGKRHLANMMGEDPLTFTQDDVDRAIEYLFPSGIYDHRARPIMKSPEQLYPARKAAEFDESGRPFHFLFYTGKPNYFKALFDINNHMDELKKYNTNLLIKKAAIDPKSKFDKTGFQFVSKEEFETIIIETVYDVEYRIFLDAIDRLIDLPHSIQKTAFIQQFFKKMIGQKQAFDIPALQYDENGKAFVTTYECLRKDARGHVTVRSPGTGLISINGKDISYFEDNQSREQLLFPLIFTGLVNSVDVECHIEGGGYSGQAGALRWGIATSLRSFVDADMVQNMRIAGLLTRDFRRRERKKPGQKGARKKFTWKKR